VNVKDATGDADDWEKIGNWTDDQDEGVDASWRLPQYSGEDGDGLGVMREMGGFFTC
jgi:hypothetical protein